MRIALAGTGIVTPLGFGVQATFDALLEGRRGTTVEEPYLRREMPRELEAQLKFLNGAGRLAVEAVEEAWEAAGWSADDVEPDRKGLWLSQMDGWDWSCVELRAGFDDATEHFTIAAEGPVLNRAIARRTKPFFILESLKNNAFSFLANLHGLEGPNTSVAGWSGATFGALDFGMRALRRGDLDRALVVGAGRHANEVGRVDLRRNAIDLEGGEAAAALALAGVADEDTSSVAVLGYGAVQGDASAAARAALEDAALGPDAPAFVVHATGDAPALAAPGVCWRDAMGTTSLASEVVDLALAAEALRRGVLPRPGAEALPVTGRHALVVTRGLHGDATAVVVEGGPCAS